MKKKLSLLLALLMLASVAALAASSKVEPITVKVVINVAEEDDRGRREVTETILETDFAYESSTPTLNDLLVQAAGCRPDQTCNRGGRGQCNRNRYQRPCSQDR